MADSFSHQPSGLADPFLHLAEVTPSDVADLDQVARGFFVGGEGDVTLTTAAGETVTLVGLPAGLLVPVRTKRIHATGTTATDLVAGW